MRFAYSRASLVLLAALLLTPAAFAQAVNPVTQIGGAGFDNGRELATDASGNLFAAGVFEGTVDFDPGSGVVNRTAASSGGDAFLVSYTPAGVLRFANNFGGQGSVDVNDIDVDAAGNVYIAGSFNAFITLNPADPNQELDAVRVRDGFVASYTPAGALRFGFNIGTADFDQAISIAVTASGGFFVTGIIEGTADFDPGAGVAELTSSGGQYYAASYDASGNYRSAFLLASFVSATSIAVDPSGNVFIGGVFQGTVDFDPGDGIAGATSVGGNADGFLASYASDLTFRRVSTFGNSEFSGGSLTPQFLATDGSGNLYVTGLLGGEIDFDPGSGETLIDNDNTTGNVFVASYDASGALRSAFLVEGRGNAAVLGIDVDASGGTSIAGFFLGGTLDFDPSGGEATRGDNTTNNFGFVASYTASGGYRFVNVFTNSVGSDVASAPSGAIYTSGLFTTIADFDQSDAELLRSSVNGSADVYIVGLNADGSLLTGNPTAIPSAAELNASLRLSVAPNPATHSAAASVETDRAQDVRVAVYDALGRQVAVLFDGMLMPGQSQTLTVDASALPAGLYMVRLTGETIRQTRTLVVAR